MDPQAFNLLTNRLDRIETKLDSVLEWRWKIAGGAFVLGVLGAGIFEIIKLVI